MTLVMTLGLICFKLSSTYSLNFDSLTSLFAASIFLLKYALANDHTFSMAIHTNTLLVNDDHITYMMV